MAVTVASLQDRFPEFASTPTTLIQACIDDAEERISRAVFGEVADQAVRYMAAHLIANNPLGELARLDKTDGKDGTAYLKEFERLQRSVAFGYRVI